MTIFDGLSDKFIRNTLMIYVEKGANIINLKTFLIDVIRFDWMQFNKVKHYKNQFNRQSNFKNWKWNKKTTVIFDL
jgi:hypothetical protein